LQRARGERADQATHSMLRYRFGDAVRWEPRRSASALGLGTGSVAVIGCGCFVDGFRPIWTASVVLGVSLRSLLLACRRDLAFVGWVPLRWDSTLRCTVCAAVSCWQLRGLSGRRSWDGSKRLDVHLGACWVLSFDGAEWADTQPWLCVRQLSRLLPAAVWIGAKPMGASGVSPRQRGGCATDSLADQSPEVEGGGRACTAVTSRR